MQVGASMQTRIYDFQIRVLLSRDGDDFVAHALEMDLVAYGKTENKAMEELRNLIRNQVAFSIEKGEDHLMAFSAPKRYFERWEKAHADALRGIIRPGKRAEPHVKAVSISFSPQKFNKIRSRSHTQRFEPTTLARA